MPATGNKSFRPLSLSIRLRADGFSFFVCDVQSAALVRGEHFTVAKTAADGEAIATPSLADRLLQALSQKEYFNPQIDQVYVLADAPFAHVPLEHFRRDEASALYGISVDMDENRPQRVGYNILPVLEVAVLYAIPSDVEETILQFYPTARFFAAEAMLLERLAAHAPQLAVNTDADRPLPLFVGVSENGINGETTLGIYHFADTQPSRDTATLNFANTFRISSSADALYFILNVWQSLGLNGNTDELLLLGHKSALIEELRASLSEYVATVRQLEANSLFPNISLAREQEVPLDLMALLLNRL